MIIMMHAMHLNASFIWPDVAIQQMSCDFHMVQIMSCMHASSISDCMHELSRAELASYLLDIDTIVIAPCIAVKLLASYNDLRR